MTIGKGHPWGDEIGRPADLRLVAGDRELALALTDGTGRPTAVTAGDLHRTIGAPDPTERDRLLALPVDVLDITLDDGRTLPAIAHVVVRSPWWRGSWWRGPVLVVMNAEFLGDWDVAPRGHPNDGRAETQLADAAMSIRDRWAARARLRAGTHVPHPAITTRSVRSASWSFERAQAVFLDGVPVGRSHSLAVTVRPDAATIFA